MPFIVRETQNIDTPQTFYNPDEDTIDFINDPDIIRDALPQPYRRIDKILQELLDDTWQIIEKRENERIIEMNKPRPAKFENLFLVENVDYVSCMCPSSDEDASLVFVGANGGINAIDSQSLIVIDQLNFEDGAQKVISISCSNIKKTAFLVSAVTDTGMKIQNTPLMSHLIKVEKSYVINETLA